MNLIFIVKIATWFKLKANTSIFVKPSLFPILKSGSYFRLLSPFEVSPLIFLCCKCKNQKPCISHFISYLALNICHIFVCICLWLQQDPHLRSGNPVVDLIHYYFKHFTYVAPREHIENIHKVSELGPFSYHRYSLIVAFACTRLHGFVLVPTF